MLYLMCVLLSECYAAETWTIEEAVSRKLLRFEMWCYKRILKVCWKDRVTNRSVREKVERQLHRNVLDKAEVETIQTHMQNGRKISVW